MDVCHSQLDYQKHFIKQRTGYPLPCTCDKEGKQGKQGSGISFYLPWCNSPQWAKTSSLSRIHDHTKTHYTRWDFSGRVISPTHRPLPDNTQHPQQKNIHAPAGIRTHNPSKRAAADPRLRPRGQWDRRNLIFNGKSMSGENLRFLSFAYNERFMCNRTFTN